jgi:phosphatidyl-myo-inositol alpha-mannosyltransferase
MKVGIVCPYSLAVPGGVQAHVLGLAAALRARGHRVEVLAPAEGPVPAFVTPAGRTVGVPYNGSVARVAFGPVAYGRVRRWLATHRFDVLHVHEPTTVSVSALALLLADGPVVVTFHAAAERSRVLAALGGLARPLLERATARIAVSPAARRLQVEHLGGDATEIPNGVDVAAFAVPSVRERATVAFVGRFDEPRKGMAVLLAALRRVERAGLRLRVVGSGDAAALRRAAGPVPVDVLGPVGDAAKAAVLASAAVFCAPHVGGESFGIVLAEAMAAGAPVVASELDAFRSVVGSSGLLVPPGDPVALAAALDGLLDDPWRRAALGDAGRARAAAFDWPLVAASVERVYRAAAAADPRRVAS